MTAAKLAVQLMILILLGLLSVRLGLVKGDFDKQFTALIMKLFIPCMIVRSMSGAFSWQEVKNCGRLVLIALALWAVTFLLGQLAYVLSGRSATGRIQRFNMLYTNFTFVGIPVVEALYGSTGVFYFVVFLVIVLPYFMGAVFNGADMVMAERRPEVEMFLPIIVSSQIGSDMKKETIKAQTVIARSNIRRILGEGKIIPQILQEKTDGRDYIRNIFYIYAYR